MSNISSNSMNNILLREINLYMSNILFLIGLIGNVLNCIVFLHPTLRRNPISIYFLFGSLSNIINLLSGMILYILNSSGVKITLTNGIFIWCKIRFLIIFVSRTTTSWLIVLGTIDRYLISSPKVHFRRMSHLKQSSRLTLLTSIICLLIWIEILFCFDSQMANSGLGCAIKSGVCRISNDIALALITIIFPSLLMLLFGFLTILNIRQIGRVQPSRNNRINVIRIKRRRSENSLILMLLSQVFVLILFNFPQSIFYIYTTYTMNKRKSSNEILIETFVSTITVLLSYIPNCLTFYVYTLTGSLFRQTFVQCIYQILPCLKSSH